MRYALGAHAALSLLVLAFVSVFVAPLVLVLVSRIH